MSSVRSLAAAVTLVFAAVLVQPAAQATTIIDFGGLSGANGDALAVYTEDGFKVTPIAGDFQEAHIFGNPVPSIFNGSINNGASTIAITSTSGGLFQFIGLDFGCGDASLSCEYSGRGMLSGVTVYSFAEGTFTTLNPGWQTVASFFPTESIDRLDLSIQYYDSNFDNIELATVATPLPAALPLFASGLGALGLLGWRRKRKAQAAA